MNKYRKIYDEVSEDAEYFFVKQEVKQEQGLTLETQTYENRSRIGASSRMTFFLVNGVIVAIANDYAENVDIFGEEY